MANTNTAAANTTPRFHLGDIVTLAIGRVRIVRIKGGQVYVQDAAIPVVDGIAPWMFGFTAFSVAAFSDSYRKANAA